NWRNSGRSKRPSTFFESIVYAWLRDCSSNTDRMSERRMMRGVFRVRSVVVCFLVLLSSLDVCAQSASTGALTGTVSDPSGAVLQNARITLRNTGTDETRIAVTDQAGLYRFSLLPPGQYELTVEAAGFAPAVARDLMIQITEVRSVATQLAVKGVREAVEVQ